MNLTNIFKNSSLEVDSYSYSSSDNMNEFVGSIGGAKDAETSDTPNGGFPPIYVCIKKEKEKVKEKESEEPIKKREYKTHKTALSITEILEKRKKVVSPTE